MVPESKRGEVSDHIYELLAGQGEFLRLKTDPFRKESCGVYLDRSELDLETIEGLIKFAVDSVENGYKFSSARMEYQAMSPLREAMEVQKGNTDKLTDNWVKGIKAIKESGFPFRDALYSAFLS